MKKTKIKRRFENAAAAFFADESLSENNLENYRTETGLREAENSSGLNQKNSSLETILKQVFFFLPGTFILYGLSIGFTVMFISALANRPAMTPRFEMIWLGMIFLAATLMTWLGLGDVRKLKHFVIPASIIGVGATVGAVIAFVLFAMPFYLRRFVLGDSFPMYIFPLALIVPFLAKGWVDRKSD